MIHMTPYQSHSLLAVLVVMVLAAAWVLYELHQRRIEREIERRLEAEAKAAQMKQPAKPARHLYLVPDQPAPEPAIYDWQTQGI